MAQKRRIRVIGGGLAGCEAAWQIARRGIEVDLYEMRPRVSTPVHQTDLLAELVCSNSLKSEMLDNASGVLKAEMKILDSLILQAASFARIPAGKALAVDRVLFSEYITRKISEHPLITLHREEVQEIPDGIAIIATGPLTSEKFALALRNLLGADFLYFFDAISPLIERDSVNMDKCFTASRYGHGEDYINCPLDPETYYNFVEALKTAETVEVHDFDILPFFEGCLPVEEMAKRGVDALRFGPMKPTGLIDPRTGKQPYAVVQLRQENLANTEVGMVGFQSRLKYPEQKRVFQMIPGLENAIFTRFARMHKNLFIQSPMLLNSFLQFKREKTLFFAGQITGVEGYVESSAMGLVAGIQASHLLLGIPLVYFPPTTAIGALLHYITHSPYPFQPTNITFGLFAPLPQKVKNRQQRNEMIAHRALSDIQKIAQDIHSLVL
ncbi:MAG: methylenetetrahydrofolate--tRNA-(uracil(54)-C(5))-methyltransferase (FADH(2)-oxidizing) TrmFO [bacterium JZ-2024 1]